jgi:hypothetical protein
MRVACLVRLYSLYFDWASSSVYWNVVCGSRVSGESSELMAMIELFTVSNKVTKARVTRGEDSMLGKGDR